MTVGSCRVSSPCLRCGSTAVDEFRYSIQRVVDAEPLANDGGCRIHGERLISGIGLALRVGMTSTDVPSTDRDSRAMTGSCSDGVVTSAGECIAEGSGSLRRRGATALSRIPLLANARAEAEMALADGSSALPADRSELRRRHLGPERASTTPRRWPHLEAAARAPGSGRARSAPLLTADLPRSDRCGRSETPHSTTEDL